MGSSSPESVLCAEATEGSEEDVWQRRSVTFPGVFSLAGHAMTAGSILLQDHELVMKSDSK